VSNEFNKFGRERSGRNLRYHLGIFLECSREITKSQPQQTLSGLKLEYWTFQMGNRIAKHSAAMFGKPDVLEVFYSLKMLSLCFAFKCCGFNKSYIFHKYMPFPHKVSECLVNCVMSLPFQKITRLPLWYY
jgi:hypothetical protein